jgi:hypothetical protein
MPEIYIGALAGTGKVALDSDVLLAVDYHLEVYQEMIDVSNTEGRHQVPAGAKRVEGTVRSKDKALPIRKRLKLVTEEGYTIDFSISNPTVGTIECLGQLLNDQGREGT